MDKQISFTADRIAKLECPIDKDQVIYWDTNNKGYLGLRITSNQVKAYIFQSRLHGQTIRLTIGKPPAMGIGDAQTEARRLKGLTDNGIDPRQVKAEAKAKVIANKEKSAPASEAWAEYVVYGTNRNKKPWSAKHKESIEVVVRKGGKEITRGLKAGMSNKQKDGILKPLIDLPLKDITRERIEAWIKREVKTRPTYTRRALALLSGFLNWANSEERYKSLVAKDICAGLSKKHLNAPNTKKDCLEREQLKLWFSAIQQIGNPVISAYLQILLLTGARRNELTGLKWVDIDTQWHKATIKDKMKGTRVIPLSPYIEFLIQPLPRRNAYVFSSALAKGKHITEPRIAHNQAVATAGLPYLTIHGLRRSFKTLSEWAVGCPEGVRNQIMGHKPQGVAEKNYTQRPIGMLRPWLIEIENFMLTEAGIPIPKPEQGDKRLKVVNTK